MQVNETLQPANTAEDLKVQVRLRDRLETCKLSQGRLLFGWIEAGAHDLELRPGRVGAATDPQVTNGRAEGRAGTLLEVVEALGFAEGLVAEGLRAEGIS